MSIIPDPETDITASYEKEFGETCQWMAPELYAPTKFGLSGFQLTRESDCYAFGMVIYEVSG